MATPRSAFLNPGYSRRQVACRTSGALALSMFTTMGTARWVAARQATPVGTVEGVGGAMDFAYVGCYTREAPGGGGAIKATGISIFAFDAASGALRFRETAPSDNPSWLALHPTGRFLYAANEIDDYEEQPSGAVVAYAVDAASGGLAMLNAQSSRGLYPAHLTLDPSGRYAIVADYSGPFVVLPIAEDGRLGAASDIVQNRGTGPDSERQEISHPHCVVFDPAGEYLVAADLGIDRVQSYRLSAAGKLELIGEAALAPGAGPRHVAFTPNARYLYVTNELNATVTGFVYEAANGTIGTEVQTVSTVPEDFSDPKSTAEIAVHPSGRFLYVSNRGAEGAAPPPSPPPPEGPPFSPPSPPPPEGGPFTPPSPPPPEGGVSPVADSIAAFTIDQASGKLTLIDYFADGLDEPRQFAIDPSGRWLYACNQQGDSIVQFAIDQETGALGETGQVTETATPVCLLFATA